jgi:hypothetical protein
MAEIGDTILSVTVSAHDVERYERHRGGGVGEAVAAFLPVNYKVVGVRIEDDGSAVVTVGGKDNGGWTAEGYVKPRLETGLFGVTIGTFAGVPLPPEDTDGDYFGEEGPDVRRAQEDRDSAEYYRDMGYGGV